MTSEKTAEEVFESLNGFDELAVSRAFGCDITALKDKPMMFLRSLLFIEMRRQGQKDPEAKQSAMNATMRELTDYFRADEDIDAGEASRHPETEQSS